MSLISEKFYNLECDRCGVLLDETWHGKVEVEEEAESSGWITHKRKHYCPECYDIDDNDNISIKPPIDENV